MFDFQDIDDKEIQILLAEYKEINQYFQHYENLISKAASIFIPLSMGIFSLAITFYKDIPDWSMLGLAFVSTGFILLSKMFDMRLRKFCNVGRERAIEIEKKLNMKYWGNIKSEIIDKKGFTNRLLFWVLILIMSITWFTLVLVKFGAISL